MSRWSPMHIDLAPVERLAQIPASAFLGHADSFSGDDDVPRALFRRWEKQHWSSSDISLERDAIEFARRVPRRHRKDLEYHFASFIVGEYTGVDLLTPVLGGAHSEEDLLFLSTQSADEALHSRFMFRVGEEVLGMNPDPAVMLQQSWDILGDAHRGLSVYETSLMKELSADPGNYRAWVRSVTLFHFITEGVLALVGQRLLLRHLERVGLLPGIRAGIAGMCRDESRHVGFGRYALRTAIAEGYADDVYDVLDTAMPMAIHAGAAGSSDADAVDHTLTALDRGMSAIGADPIYREHLVRSARLQAIQPQNREAS